MSTNELSHRRFPKTATILWSVACWALFLCWMVGIYIRRGGGSSLEM